MLSILAKAFFRLSLLPLILTGCGAPLPSGDGPPAVESPTPVVEPGEMANVYQNDTFKVSLRYPEGWQRLEGDPASGEKIGGPDGFFSTGALSNGMSLDELARSEAEHALQPFGSSPTIEEIEILGREARLVLPSADQPKLLPDEPAWGMLLVPYPRPVLVEKTLAGYFALYADLDHIRPIAASLTFEEQPALFPPESDTPAAGICEQASGNPVELVLTLDVPSPRCMQLHPGQTLALANRTGTALLARLAWYEIPLEPEETVLLDVPVGSFLAPGVHHLDLQGSGNSPEIWLLP